MVVIVIKEERKAIHAMESQGIVKLCWKEKKKIKYIYIYLTYTDDRLIYQTVWLDIYNTRSIHRENKASLTTNFLFSFKSLLF